MEERNQEDQKNADVIPNESKGQCSEADTTSNGSLGNKKCEKIVKNNPETNMNDTDSPSNAISDEESFTEISDDGWEDILGSGRLKKRILKEGKKGLTSEGLGRPSRNDNVTISLKGAYFIKTHSGFIELKLSR